MNGTNTTAVARQQRADNNRAVVNHGEGLEISWEAKTLNLIRRTVAVDLNDQELAWFSNICKSTGLNPIQKQIYAYHMGGKLVIQTGIDGYRLIASRTGEYEGQTEPQWADEDGNWHDAWLQSTPPSAARVGVYRKGFRTALYAVVTWAEFGGGKNENWTKRPAHMLAKTAEVHALRKAFPTETAGVELAPDPDAARAGAPPEVIDLGNVEMYSGDPPPAPAPEPITLKKLHAAGSERGLDHDALHQMAVERYGIGSLTELTRATAADFYERIRQLPVMPRESGPAATTIDLE